MYALYAEVCQRNLPEKTESDEIIESDMIDNLYRLSQEISEEVSRVSYLCTHRRVNSDSLHDYDWIQSYNILIGFDWSC